jgi:DNA polymerase-1
MAFMSQEDAIISALNAKKDIHCHMTSLVEGIDYDLLDAVVVQKDKKHPRYNELSKKRSAVKTVTFGVPYGAGPKRVGEMIQEKDQDGNPIETMDHAIDRAKELIENYFSAAPKLLEWLQEQKRLAQTSGYTKSIQGRMRFYELPDKRDPNYEMIMSQIGRYAGNHPIQSSSADMLKDAMKRQYLTHRGWDGAAAEPWTGPKVLDSNLLLVCHDEIVTDAAERDVDQQQELLVRAMTGAYRAVSMPKVVNGVSKTIYLKDIYMEMDPIVADYWAKD